MLRIPLKLFVIVLLVLFASESIWASPNFYKNKRKKRQKNKKRFDTYSTFYGKEPEKKWGLGFIIAGPSGFSAKYKLSHTEAIDFALSWSMDDNPKRYVHADYLMVKHRYLMIDDNFIHPYFGLGGRLYNRLSIDDEDGQIALRIPGGAVYELQALPIDVFMEAAGSIYVYPNTGFEVSIGIGARYLF